MARLVGVPALLLVLAVVCSAKPAVKDDVTDIDLLMPGVQPTVADTYLCLPMRMGADNTYLTGFVPHANMSTAHHMLLFGCEEPGEQEKVWSCGEMMSKSYEKTAPPCRSAPKIVYAWAMDAPELKLPKGVGFKVGGDTDIKWLVLQVHYKDVSHFIPPENHKDISGLTLHTTKTPQPKRAGVYLLSTGGQIPAHSTTYMEAACSDEEPQTVHPFAYRVHAHAHGQVVSGYRVRDGQWTEIGRKSPKEPQMFYNVTHPGMEVEKGDILAARCTMVNDEDRTVMVGQTQQDEMCNFYIMYWMSGDATMSQTYCTTSGPPGWYWNSIASIHVENSPADASRVPGSDKILEASANLLAEAGDTLENDLSEMFPGEALDLRNELEKFEDFENLIRGFGRQEIERQRQQQRWAPIGYGADYYNEDRYYPQY